MTIEQRQADAENWADAYRDWVAADEQAHQYDELRVQAMTRLDLAYGRVMNNAAIGAGVRTRVYMMPLTNSCRRELVKVTYNSSNIPSIELLKTEPNE